VALLSLSGDRKIAAAAVVAAGVVASFAVLATREHIAPDRALAPSERETPDRPQVHAGTRREESGAIEVPVMASERATGVVVDREGRPVATARVIAAADAGGRGLERPGASTREAHVDRLGRFEVALPGGKPYYALLVEAEGFAPEFLHGVRDGDDVRAVLSPACSLVGRVYDSEGGPIAGASVRWIDASGPLVLERSAISAEGGGYRIDGLPVDSAVELPHPFRGALRVDAEGFSPQQASVPNAQAAGALESRLDVVLVRPATITGRVLDAETGEPIAGASVGAWTQTWPPSTPPVAQTTTRADGRFVLDDVPADDRSGSVAEVELRATAAGQAPGRRSIPQPGEGQTRAIDFRLPPAGSLRGRVIDERARPVKGAAVQAWIEGVSATPASTGEGGRFSVDDVPAWRSKESEASLLVTTHDSVVTERVTTAVRAGALTEVPDIVVPARREAEFLVVDSEGRPVWGAEVSNESLPIRGRTDREGRLRVLFPGTEPFAWPFRMAVRTPGFAPALTPDFVPSLDEPPLVKVVLGPPRRVSGRVVLTDGRPAADATVSVGNGALPLSRVFPTSQDIACFAELHPTRGPVETYASACVGADGSFEIDGLPEGPFHVKAARTVRGRDESKMKRRFDVDDATLAADPAIAVSVPSDATGLRLTLPADGPVPPNAVLEGSIVDAASGRPLLGATVALVGSNWYAEGERLPVGRFRFPPKPFGAYTLRCSAAGYVGWEGGVELNEWTSSTPMTIRLERGAMVRGVVRGPEGIDLADAVVALLTIEGNRWGGSSWIASDGTFEVRGLVPGRYRAALDGVNPYWRGATLAPSRTIPIEITTRDGEHVVELEVQPAGTLDVVFWGVSHLFYGPFGFTPGIWP
jgi:hypothetical protein